MNEKKESLFAVSKAFFWLLSAAMLAIFSYRFFIQGPPESEGPFVSGPEGLYFDVAIFLIIITGAFIRNKTLALALLVLAIFVRMTASVFMDF